jgi:hypothetical protein
MKRNPALERWLLGESSAEESAPLRDRARHDEELRNVYDDYFAVLRALEAGEGLDDAASAQRRVDVDQATRASAEEVRWLSDDFFRRWADEPRARVLDSWFGRVGWLNAFAPVVVVAAALIVLWIGISRDEAGVSSDDSRSSGLVARGSGERAEVELELFCGEPPAPVNDARCALHQQLTFAARATRDAEPRTLSVFGIGPEGDVKYYAPTPSEADGMAIAGERWQTMDFSVQLTINHQPGLLRVFAVLAPRAATVDEIDAWASALAEHASSFDATDSWISHLAQLDGALTVDLCPDFDACDAVQTQLRLDSSGEHP